MPFLPLTTEEMRERGWDAPDAVVVTGDAYVDHPSFGAAIISRVLEAEGLRVCMLSQPESTADFTRFGRPRLGFFIGGGILIPWSPIILPPKRRRSDDAYTPGGRAGARPDRAVLVYCRQARDAYPDVPQIIGGLEASLRRFAHYDYWDDRVRPSILIESGADLLVYTAWGEAPTAEIARRLREGEPISSMTDIRGTCFSVPVKDYIPRPAAECPRFELAAAPTASGKRQYAVSCRIQQEEQDAVRGRTVIQRHGERMLVQNPPMPPLSTEEFDRVYELPYMRDVHPSTPFRWEACLGSREVRFSITHNRGCIGGCHFCSLAFHQGRQITCRSEGFGGAGGRGLDPPAGLQRVYPRCGRSYSQFPPSFLQRAAHPGGLCKNKQCLAPAPCPAMEADHRDYLHLLRRLRALPGIKRSSSGRGSGTII